MIARDICLGKRGKIQKEIKEGKIAKKKIFIHKNIKLKTSI